MPIVASCLDPRWKSLRFLTDKPGLKDSAYENIKILADPTEEENNEESSPSTEGQRMDIDHNPDVAEAVLGKDFMKEMTHSFFS